MFFTLKFKFLFNFGSNNLHFNKSGYFCSTNKDYLISNLDYIIIDQIHVDNDDEGKGTTVSIGDEQNGIPSKIIINTINEGFEEVFSGSVNLLYLLMMKFNSLINLWKIILIELEMNLNI